MSSGRHRAIRCLEVGQRMRSIVPHQRFLEINNFCFDDSLRFQNIEIGFWNQKNMPSVPRHYVFMISPTSANVKIF
jgi:hypothetical protein